MAFIKERKSVEYYLCTSKKKIPTKGHIKEEHIREIHIIKSGSKGLGYILNSKGVITTPKELIGKRIKLKVEIVEEKE